MTVKRPQHYTPVLYLSIQWFFNHIFFFLNFVFFSLSLLFFIPQITSKNDMYGILDECFVYVISLLIIDFQRKTDCEQEYSGYICTHVTYNLYIAKKNIKLPLTTHIKLI